MREVKLMKKIIAAMIALAAVSSAAYASPLTTYQKGQTEINVGMWDASAKSNLSLIHI